MPPPSHHPLPFLLFLLRVPKSRFASVSSLESLELCSHSAVLRPCLAQCVPSVWTPFFMSLPAPVARGPLSLGQCSVLRSSSSDSMSVPTSGDSDYSLVGIADAERVFPSLLVGFSPPGFHQDLHLQTPLALIQTM